MSASDDDSLCLSEASELVDVTTRYLCGMNCSLFAEILRRYRGRELNRHQSLQKKWVKLAKSLDGAKSLKILMTFMLSAKLSMARNRRTLGNRFRFWRGRLHKGDPEIRRKWRSLAALVLQDGRVSDMRAEQERLIATRATLAAAFLVKQPDFAFPKLRFLFTRMKYDEPPPPPEPEPEPEPVEVVELTPTKRVEVIEIESPRRVAAPQPVLAIEAHADLTVDRALVSDETEESYEEEEVRRVRKPKQKPKSKAKAKPKPKPKHEPRYEPRHETSYETSYEPRHEPKHEPRKYKEVETKVIERRVDVDIGSVNNTNVLIALVGFVCFMIGFIFGSVI